MHDWIGPLLEALGEVGAAAEPSVPGLRWLRIGCTAVLLLMVVGLLTISLWWPR